MSITRNPRTRRRLGLVGLALAGLLATLLSSAVGAPSASAVTPTTSFRFTVSTGLLPRSFKPSMADYVTRCQAGVPFHVSVTVPPGHEGLVDGIGSTSSFTAPERLTYGQGFSVTDVDLSGGGHTYYVRCLPPDFPNFTAKRVGNPQAAYYVVSPQATSPTALRYVAIFDNDGTPVWWMSSTGNFADSTLLPNGDIAWVPFMPSGPIQEHSLAGPLSRQISVNGYPSIDLHEVQLLPDGSYLLAVQVTKPADESFMTCGAQTGLASTIVGDDIIVEVRPDGTVAWSWDALDHIPLTATDPNFYCAILANGAGGALGELGYDNYHFNSAADDGTQVLASFRNLSAVFLIDKATGNIVWKLGGSAIPGVQDLSFVNDPFGNFGGQHDARFYFGPVGGMQITLHDDGTQLHRSPRAVRYRIDNTNHTATLLDDVTDPLVTSSFCCGGARKLPMPRGDWVMSWGASSVVTELSSDGTQRPFLLQWTDPGVFSYRAEPVLPGELSRTALRADMNIQYPRI